MTSIELLRFMLITELRCHPDDAEIRITDGHWIVMHLNRQGDPAQFTIGIGCQLDTPEILEGNVIDTRTGNFHHAIGFYNLSDWRDLTSLVSTGMALGWISYGITLIEQSVSYQTAPESLPIDYPDEAPF